MPSGGRSSEDLAAIRTLGGAKNPRPWLLFGLGFAAHGGLPQLSVPGLWCNPLQVPASVWAPRLVPEDSGDKEGADTNRKPTLPAVL